MYKLIALFLSVVLTFSSAPVSAGKTAKSAKETTKHVVSTVKYEKRTDSEAEKDRTDICELEYDSKGRLIQADSKAYSGYEKYLHPDFIYSVIIPGTDYFEYNDDDTVSKVTRKNDDGDVRFTVDYEYKDGKVDREIYTNGSKEIVSQYTYREDGLLEYVDRDEGQRVSQFKFSYKDDGTLDHMRLREKIAYYDLDYVSNVFYNDDGTLNIVSMTSGNTMDESTSFYFTYNDAGDLQEVNFTQGYFKSSYRFIYEYEDITVTK